MDLTLLYRIETHPLEDEFPSTSRPFRIYFGNRTNLDSSLKPLKASTTRVGSYAFLA
jgi:hypothetical protein